MPLSFEAIDKLMNDVGQLESWAKNSKSLEKDVARMKQEILNFNTSERLQNFSSLYNQGLQNDMKFSAEENALMSQGYILIGYSGTNEITAESYKKGLIPKYTRGGNAGEARVPGFYITPNPEMAEDFAELSELEIKELHHRRHQMI